MFSLNIERIVGSLLAYPDQFKYVVSIHANEEHICGGTIISEDSILSAAHCFFDQKGNFEDKDYEVITATLDSKKVDGNSYKVTQIYVPKEFFNQLNLECKHDIAVLKVSYEMKASTLSNLYIYLINFTYFFT